MLKQGIKRILFLTALVLAAVLPGCTATLTFTPSNTVPAATTTRTINATIYAPFEPPPATAGLTTLTTSRELTFLVTQKVTINAPGGYPPGGLRSIRHTYSTFTTSRLETGNATFTPDTGWVYLVMNMNIQNLGYNKFPVSMNNYTITFGGQPYSPIALSGLEKALPVIPDQLPYGRVFEGLIVFRVPANIRGSIQIQYTGPSGYSTLFSSIREYVQPTPTIP